MALTKQVSHVKMAIVAAVLCVPVPALAQTVFGQEAPQQFLLNKMLSPRNTGQAPSTAEGGAVSNSTQGGSAQAANAANADDDDGPGPWPKRYLLNRLMGQ
jgi:hypothetical protein